LFSHGAENPSNETASSIVLCSDAPRANEEGMKRRAASEREGELIALREFLAYNAFVRKRYFDLIAGLPKEVLARDRGASYPTILDIHTHVLDVLRSWIHVYETGEDLPAPGRLSVAQLLKFELDVDTLLEEFALRLKPEDLNKSFSFAVSVGEGKELRTLNLGEMLWHLIEEELQHRGELNALLWQEDIEPPITDWFDWKKATGKRGAPKGR